MKIHISQKEIEAFEKSPACSAVCLDELATSAVREAMLSVTDYYLAADISSRVASGEITVYCHEDARKLIELDD